MNDDPGGAARSVVDAARYMTIATADADGRPWASPVWFAHDGYRDFVWVSKPEARHSQNIAARPDVAIAIFDSTVPPGKATGEAVYIVARAEQVTGSEVDAVMETFSRRSAEQGLDTWSAADVAEPAALRSYRARASELFLLGEGDLRIPVDPAES